MRAKLLAGLAVVIAGVTAVACSDAPSAPASPRDMVVALAKGGNGSGNGNGNGGTKPGNTGSPTSTDSLVSYLASLPDTLSRTPGPVVGMQRLAPLGGGVSASASIGSAGGMVELPAAGVYLWVPPGAVSVPTTFSITAKPGKAVAYDFQPAGSVFAVPVVVIQDKSVLDATVPSGFGAPALGYFSSDADVDPSTATGTGSQLRGLLPVSTAQYLAFPVWHFSGYIVCWGRSAE